MSVLLSEHLPLLATAPDGIQKLRGLILELAVRGKLVPQDSKAEPASELLKRIARERARLEAEGICKKLKPMPPVTEDELPYSVPDGWQFARLGSLLLGISSGGTPSKNNPAYWNGDIPWASVKDLGFGEPLTDTQDRITKEGLEAGSFLAVTGSILVCTRMGLGKIGEAKIGVAINQDLKALQLSSEFNKQFFINFFKTLSIKGSGMTVAGIKQDELLGFNVPVPPLAEQHRIVAKVDELMALCDRLEAEQTDAEAAHAKLVETLLGTLTQSTDAADLAANWQRLAEYFDPLFTTESSLDALKQTILQLAVMGKLEESVSGRWETERLDRVCEEIVDCPHSTPKWTATGKICVRTSQFKPGKLDLSACRFVSEATFVERIARLAPAADDILYSREGGILGVACRVPPEVELCLGQRMMLMRPGNRIASAFLELVLNSPVITEIARQNTTGGAAPRVNVSTVKSYPIPVPPLNEQLRIVAKVDELMTLCDRLKADLVESRTRQARLSATLIESALQAA